MLDWTWITVTATEALMVVISALGIYAALVVCTRLVGLRSFSKMSGFDFAITVAVGSLVASTLLLKDVSLLRALVGLVTLFTIQFVVAELRTRVRAARETVDNDPLLLMAGPEILHENLKKAHITESDLMGKLREANVIHPDQVRAVVMETTGDVSVLHAGPDGPDLDLGLLAGVRGTEHLHGKPHVRRADGE